jgi:hypothetical protein
MIRRVLRLESLALLVFFLTLYEHTLGSWGMFALLILTPDLSLLGYAKNKKSGAYLYNIVHNYAMAGLIGLVGFMLGSALLTQYALILGCHIAIDRIFGFGLKYENSFKSTHLQKID